MSEDWAWARIVIWKDLFSEAQDPEIPWLAEPFIERGTANSVYGDVKAGKSLLMQDIGARLATGRPVLASAARPPVHVLYLDWENNQDLLRERYRDKMGYTAKQLSPHLHYASYPELRPMDTAEGGQQACRLAQANQAHLVIIDTTSRVIAGAESSADTFADVYRYTLMPMKRAGITTVRIDHEGKDATRGQRGSSAKGADVDVVWHLTEGPKNHLLLHPDYERSMHAAQFRVVRLDDPLRHEMVTAALTPAQGALANALSQVGVPAEAGRDACREALKIAGLGARTEDLAAVIRWRKTQQARGGIQAGEPGFAEMYRMAQPERRKKQDS
jgi:AAA domain-containing protein